MSDRSQFFLLRTRRFGPFFATQTLGAFNDNVFKNALIILLTFGVAGLSTEQINQYVNLAAGLFILPFFLFSATAGQIAERYEKSALIRLIKLCEIGIMVLGGLALWSGNIVFLMAILFLMGAQSSLFGPVKYSILPQALHETELVGGNALVEAATFLAILIGTLVGGWLIARESGSQVVGLTVVGTAIAGYLAARRIPPAPATAPTLKINWNPLTETWRNFRFMRSNRTVFLSVLGISWFWLYGATFLAQLPNYTRVYLGGNEEVVTLLLTLFSLGIGLGSLLCERLSGHKVEMGLVPLGSIGLTLFGIDLYFAVPDVAAHTGLGAMAYLEQAGSLRVVIDLFLTGVFGGFYIVPLYAVIQTRSEASHRSRIIAGNNILNALFMVVSALASIALLKAGLTIPQLLLTVAIMNAAVAAFIYTLLPEYLMRFLVWMLITLLYRIRREGLENVPEEGAAIITCNHVSFVDALILGGTVRRPIRFVMYHKIFRIPVLNFIFRTARAIPIAPAKEDPELLEKAYADIDQALRDGELVGLFPEGALTPDGEIQTFKPGLERILARTPVPVIPMAVRGLWQSMWSRRDSRMGRSRLPRRFRARIELIAQGAMPGLGLKISELEQRIRGMRGDQA